MSRIRIQFVLAMFLGLGSMPACNSAGREPVSSQSSPGPDAPTAARLFADVRWLADDAQEGRRAGSAAELRVANWLSERFQKLGLSPAGPGGYLQSFEVDLPPRDGGASSLGGEGLSKVFRAPSLAPMYCSSGGKVVGQLAWGGFGISRPDLGWDDFASARKSRSLQGRVVLIVRGLPSFAPPIPPSDAKAGANPDSARTSSGWGGADSLFTKVMNAKRAGAAAVLVAPHPGQANAPLGTFEASRVGHAGIHAMFVSLDVARALEPAYDTLVRSLEGPQRSPMAFAPISAPRVELVADVIRERGRAHNVLARKPGQDSSRFVLVGAHFDHLGRGGEGSLAASSPSGQPSSEIHNGADDNASGTALVLELARRAAQAPVPECDLVFALWSAEEQGLLGSEYWATHPTIALDGLLAKLNFDMVGRAESGKLAILGAGTAQVFGPWIEDAAKKLSLEPSIHRSGAGVGGSDHQTFLKREIPALHFFTGLHTDYHRPSDDFERFEAAACAQVTDLAQALLSRVSSLPKRPEFVKIAEPAASVRQGAGWSVRFGSVPEYSFEGPGVLFAGTSPDSPAEKAGLQKGDVLVEFADIQVERVEDLMFGLQSSKPGDVVRVRWRREGALMEARVTLESREAR